MATSPTHGLGCALATLAVAGTFAGCGSGVKTGNGPAVLSCLRGVGNVDVRGADYLALAAPYHALLHVKGDWASVSVWSSSGEADLAASRYRVDGTPIDRHGTVILVWVTQPSPTLRQSVDACTSR